MCVPQSSHRLLQRPILALGALAFAWSPVLSGCGPAHAGDRTGTAAHSVVGAQAAYATPSDADAVEATARDYIEGWYEGDAARMDRALHDDLVKRMPVQAASSDSTGLRPVSKARMLQLTADGGGRNPDADVEVVIDHVSRDIATARVASPDYLDYLHLAKTSSGWKIVNVLFHTRE